MTVHQSFRRRKLVLGSLCVLIAGCVEPGDVQPGLVRRYQQAVRDRSPQPRAGRDGLELLQPIPDRRAVPLKIWIQTGQMDFEVRHQGKRLSELSKDQRNQLTQRTMDQLVEAKLDALADKFALSGLVRLTELEVEFESWRMTVRPTSDRKALHVSLWAVDRTALTNKLEAVGQVLAGPAPAVGEAVGETATVTVSPEDAVRLLGKLNAAAARLAKTDAPSRQVGLVIRNGDWRLRIRRPWKTKLALRVDVQAKDRETLDGRVAALRAILGKSLNGSRNPLYGAHVVYLGQDEAIRLGLANSMDVRVVSFDPAITREDMVQAAAAFDVTVFASLLHTIQDENSASAPGTAEAHNTDWQVGLRKHTTYGGDVSATWDFTRTSDNSAFTALNRRYESAFTLAITQPLLRNAGRDFNLAGLRIARLGHRTSLSQFREQVLALVGQVQTSYWTLAQALADYDIQQRLLDRTIETRDSVLFRGEMDATAVEVRQAEAEIENRRAALVRSEKTIHDAQDQLVRLLADDRLGLLGRYGVAPETPPATSAIRIDRVDQIKQALLFNPLLEQARLAIATADLNVTVARNETRPVLNLVASVAAQGLRDSPGGAFSEMSEFAGHDYLSYTVGATFEYPIGNRGPKSALRQRRFERLQAVAAMQNVADQVALAVNDAVREVETTIAEILAYRAALRASRAKLQSLEDLQELRGLTPEFLQLKLNAQRELAEAARLELRATMDLNRALAALDQVTGTTLQKRNIKLAAEAVVGHRPPPEPKP